MATFHFNEKTQRFYIIEIGHTITGAIHGPEVAISNNTSGMTGVAAAFMHFIEKGNRVTFSEVKAVYDSMYEKISPLSEY